MFANFEKKGSGVIYAYREGINTPRVCYKGQQPLIECAKRDFKIIYFPFFYYFFSNQQGYCPCSYVSPGVMKKSDLRSSLSKNVHVF